MIRFLEGDLLTVSGIDVMVHQVNCLGIMGAGIAKQIKMRYPDVYQEYSVFCGKKEYKKSELLGECLISDIQFDGRRVANLFGQYDFFGQGRKTDYDALEHALKFLISWCVSNGIKSVGIPYKLGCGLAGGNWDDVVLPMITKLADNNPDVDFVVVKL